MLISSQKEIGKLIKNARRILGMSGSKLAAEAATSPARISRIEHGKENITVTISIKIAKAFGKKLHITFK